MKDTVQIATYKGLKKGTVESNSSTLLKISTPDKGLFEVGNTVEFYIISCNRYNRYKGIVKNIDNNIISIIDIKNLGSMTRRKYVRLKVAMPVEICLADGTACKKAKTVDISGGGLNIQTTDKLDVGTIVDLKIAIGEKIDAKCRVLRSVQKKDYYESSLEFISIPLRDRILNFIFTQTWLDKKDKVTIDDILK